MIALTNFTHRSAGPQHLQTGLPASLSPEGAAFLRSELQRQPEIRPDVLARARALVNDPTYPNLDVLRVVASQLLASPDPSDDES